MKEHSPEPYSLEREPVFQEAYVHLVELRDDLDTQWQRAFVLEKVGLCWDNQSGQNFLLSNQARILSDQHMQKYLKELSELFGELETCSREIDELRGIGEVFAEGIGATLVVTRGEAPRGRPPAPPPQPPPPPKIEGESGPSPCAARKNEDGEIG